MLKNQILCFGALLLCYLLAPIGAAESGHGQKSDDVAFNEQQDVEEKIQEAKREQRRIEEQIQRRKREQLREERRRLDRSIN